MQFPIGCSPPLLLLLFLLWIGSKQEHEQEQEADLELRSSSEKNSRLSEFSMLISAAAYARGQKRTQIRCGDSINNSLSNSSMLTADGSSNRRLSPRATTNANPTAAKKML